MNYGLVQDTVYVRRRLKAGPKVNVSKNRNENVWIFLVHKEHKFSIFSETDIFFKIII